MPASMIAGEAVYERRTYSVQDPFTVMELPGRIRTPSRAANCAVVLKLAPAKRGDLVERLKDAQGENLRRNGRS
jgi:hypothetical protein